MFVLPFFVRSKIQSGIPWQLVPITLFLENRGKQVCQTDDVDAWLQINGFVCKTQWIEKGIAFVEIDQEKTRLRDFYSFEQLTQEQQKGTEECWRTFFIMISVEEKDSCGAWNSSIEPTLLNHLQAIQSKCML